MCIIVVEPRQGPYTGAHREKAQMPCASAVWPVGYPGTRDPSTRNPGTRVPVTEQRDRVVSDGVHAARPRRRALTVPVTEQRDGVVSDGVHAARGERDEWVILTRHHHRVAGAQSRR